MVRFEKDRLVIEIPCTDDSPVTYYEGLQNALYDVFWMATTNGNRETGNGANWIAAYLGPALAVLEPSAKTVLTQMAEQPSREHLPTADDLTDEQLLAFVRNMSGARFQTLLQNLNWH